MSEKENRLKKPVLYIGIGVIAAVTSFGLYAGAQFAFQKFENRGTQQAALDNPASAEDRQTTATGDAGMQQLKKTSDSFRVVAKKVGPAVVNIKATKGKKEKKATKLSRRRSAPEEDDGSPFRGGDPFFDFFERFGSPFPMPESQQPQTSLGSGIIVDKSGIVVTNNHVVEDSSEILVRLAQDKTDMKAKVLGTDPKTDLAVLKIEGAKDLPYAEWSDSDAVEVGDWAIAIGSPFALDQSVTVGIVSAKGRNQVGLGNEMGGDLIQTDAAINPGNSGGPLCDLDGRVMGVNTAIYTRSGGYMGIGFAIPSNLAKEIVGKLIKDGKVVRGWLGVMIQPLDAEMAKDIGVKDGVAIHEVIEGSPAEKAGLKASDVVIEVEGKAIKDVNQLQRIIGGFKPGQTVKLKVVGYSDKKSRDVSVKIGTLPAEMPEAGSSSSGEGDEEADKIGLVVSQKGKEVVVKAIQPGSLAETMLGLEVGDVLVEINRQAVNSIATYKKLIKSKRLNLVIKRKGRTLFFQFVLPE